MVYGVLRLINFAHGDVYMLGAFAGYYIANALMLDAHPSVLWAILVTIGAIAMRATSYNLSLATLMGVNTNFIIAFTFALGSALAAAAGVLVALAIPRIDPLMGLMTGLKAFVAAVLGGIGNIPGAMLGGMLIGLMETWLGATAYSTYRDAVAFAVLILILLFRPAGILGSSVTEKV